MPPRLDDAEFAEFATRPRTAHPSAARPDWYRIEAKAKDKTAEIWIMDEIGFWGTTAQDFARDLKAIDAEQITLHLNTPGGDAFDGVAIYNSLKDHPATITTVVEALAASAGSLIAMAGDKVRMNRGAQMMIHDASGICFGDAADMAALAKVLDKLSTGYASIYAAKAGGDVEAWRNVMRGEAWYTAEEAVAAGLADEAVAQDDPAAQRAVAHWDLGVFAYAGRQSAPAPPPRPSAKAPPETPPAPTSAGGSTTDQKGAGMDPARLAKLREAYDLPADAPEADVLTAMASDVPAPAPAPAPTPTPEGQPQKTPAPSAGSDAVLMDPAHLAQLQAQAARGDEAFRKMREAECDAVIRAAIADGKFPPSREEHYRLRWATDPDGTEDEIKRLAKNTIPVSASGYTGVGDETEQDMIYNAMYPGSGSLNGQVASRG